jgi:succinate dehydrogenase (ubiquinone) cytochrome b560 subunit
MQRPLSPHLTIYKPQLTTILSISFRGAGAALTGMVYGFGLMYAAVSFPSLLPTIATTHQGVTDALLSQAAVLHPALTFLGKATIAFPFSYHYCNGIRHLCWDMGLGLSLNGVYKGGYASILAAVLMALGLICIPSCSKDTNSA